MHQDFKKFILEATQARDMRYLESIQELWSGYGEIARYQLIDPPSPKLKTVIVKHVRLSEGTQHPRGWNTALSHQRKVQSYQVECRWYESYNHHCADKLCRSPQCFAINHNNQGFIMLLEDLDAQGFPERREQVKLEDMHLCLQWLARFHATFVGKKAEGLWPSGTYWHLQTRPDEWKALDDQALKKAAEAIDQKLRNAHYQSFVHGDAKLANFCFGKDAAGHPQVAALDFQYVGGGCGMKDVAYFIGSCLYEDDCERYEAHLLEVYFKALRQALATNDSIDAEEMEEEWRSLYPYAWADFHRFLKGWSPGHWKINSYSEKLCRQVISELSLA